MASANREEPLVYPALPDHVRSGGLRGAISLFGPGAIIASVTIGSGETLFASRAGAIFGYGLLWFIVVCVGCKLVQVYTGARYMVLTGEHPMEAWARLPGPRGWFPACLGALSVFCFPFWLGALSMMVGTALNWIMGLDTDADEGTQWRCAQLFSTAVLLLAVVLTLVQSYRVLEKVQTAIVALLLLAILAAVVLAPVDWLRAAGATFTIELPAYADWMHASYPDVVRKETALVSMVVFMAAIGGGTYDYIGYLSFFREKRWGALKWAARKSDEPQHPPLIEQSDANLTVGRRWLRAPLIDVFTGFACVLVFTMAFNILGAAILHPEHVVPDKFDLLTPQVAFLTRFGSGFKYLYQVGILMAFWGTIYGAFEIYSRTAYECFRPLFRRVRHMSYARFRLPVCLYTGLGGLLLAWTMKDPLAIVRPIAPIAMLTCGIWCFAMIWADRRFLPGRLQMNALWVLLNVLAGAAMIGFGAQPILD